jgi:hypothetical protein
MAGAGFVHGWDDGATTPYLWNRASRTFITCDDPQSLAIKGAEVPGLTPQRGAPSAEPDFQIGIKKAGPGYHTYFRVGCRQQRPSAGCGQRRPRSSVRMQYNSQCATRRRCPSCIRPALLRA